MDPAQRLLVVDDQEMTRELLERRFRKEGFGVDSVASGRAALECLGRNRYDAVLLDINMPDFDGLRTLASIRERHSMLELPVIMVTGREEKQDLVKAMRMGANDYVSKPVDFATLLARTNTQLHLRRMQVELIKARQEAQEASLAKAEFMANLGLGLRTPMDAIIGSLERLGQTKLDPEQKEHVAILRSAFETLISIVSEVLDLSRLEAGPRERETAESDRPDLPEQTLGLTQPRPPAQGLQAAAAPPQPAAGTPAPAEPAPAPPVRPLQILLVDDTPENRMLIRAFLKKTPHLIDEAEDGRRAVDKFVAGAYDLVLMDIEMPVMNGYEATEQIRRWEVENQKPPTPIIACTAHAVAEHIRRSQAAGCDAHLSKPIKRDTLLKLIAEHAPK